MQKDNILAIKKSLFLKQRLPNTAYIAIGANMGDKLKNCQRALSDLNRMDSVRVEAVSRFYFTAPMEYSDQPWFVNGAARISTSAEPAALLAILKSLEADYGRKAGGVRFGPRPLDMDIIFFNELIVDTPYLILPHPRMHLREFVLRPIRDIAPDLMHPVFCKSIAGMLEVLRDENQQCLPVEAMPG